MNGCSTNDVDRLYCSKQQESAKLALSSSGPVTPGTSSQPSPPLPQSATPVTASATAVASSTDVKSTAGLTDIKEECKTPGLASLSSGSLTSTSSGFGFNVSLDKDETKVRSGF